MKDRRAILKGLFVAAAAASTNLNALSGEPSTGRAQEDKFGPDYSSTVEQWGIQELRLRSTQAHANPFRDVSLKGKFRSGSKEIEVEGFYDGDSTWKIRMMPQVQGSWAFTTRSNDSELDSKSGSFEVGAPSKNNHGPVHVRNQYHFAYEDGTDFYLLGTTTYGGLTAGPLERIRTVTKLSHFPFNKSRFMLLSAFPNAAKNVEPPFQMRADGNADYTRPNPAYYAEVEKGLSDLQTLGVEADLIFFVPYAQRMGVRTVSDMGKENDEAYLHYAVARLAAFPNVWWTVANEYNDFIRPKDWKALGELIESLDPYRHMLGIHNGVPGYYNNYESWVTHVINQDVTLQRLAAVPRNDAFLELDARKIGKPVVVDEYSYEGNLNAAWGAIGPREIVDMHWSITMTGAYASHGESYFGTMNEDEFVGDAPIRLGFLKRIMSEAPYQELAPANDIVHYKVGAYVPTALAKRGSYYLIHFPEAREAYTWNPGVYGPATPSKPLPLKPLHPMAPGQPVSTFDALTEIEIGGGIFKVDMVDEWRMKVIPLGYCNGPRQKFLPAIAPGLIRLVKVENVEPGARVANISELIAGLARF